METSRRTASPRPEKLAVVDEVRTKLSSADAAILTEYRGLSVKDLAELRRGLRAAGGEYKVYKNTLVRFAVRELGIEGLEALLEGPTAITFVAGDAVAVAKTLRDFARTNPNLVVKGGVLGANVLSAADAGALADIPPRDVLLARLAGLIAAPMQQFAGLLQAVPRSFAYGLAALIDQRGGPEVAPAEAPSPAEPVTEPAVAESVDSVEPVTEPVESAEPVPASSASPVAESSESSDPTESTESPVSTESPESSESTADTTAASEEGAQ